MIPKKLRDDLLECLGVSNATLTRRAQQFASLNGPMSTDDAKLIVAHEQGLTLLRYLPKDEVERIRLMRVNSQTRDPSRRARRPPELPTIAPSFEQRPPTRRGVFDGRDFHPVVRKSRSLFADGHLVESVRKAFQETHNRVKKLSGLGTSGQNLMEKVFKPDQQSPALQLNALSNQSELDEQKGLQWLMMGSTAGFRNVASHESEWRWDGDDARTLECLGLASLLNYLLDVCETYGEQHQRD